MNNSSCPDTFPDLLAELTRPMRESLTALMIGVALPTLPKPLHCPDHRGEGPILAFHDARSGTLRLTTAVDRNQAAVGPAVASGAQEVVIKCQDCGHAWPTSERAVARRLRQGRSPLAPSAAAT
jgi:hypothetical protein